jgi:hypothetical protein
MTMKLQDALQHFNIGLGQWYGWKKVDDDGNVIPNDQRMSYQHLVMHNPSAIKPTEQEINNKIAEYDAQEYARNRQAEYPPLNDLIVALWENVIEERAASVIELEAKRQDVKTKYPKG